MPRLLVALALVIACTAPAAAEPIGPELADYLGSRRGFKKVRKDVLGWHKTMRNGCVAMVSTALRHLGVEVPQREQRDGMGVSRITLALQLYLQDDLGWTRFELASEDDDDGLVQGDLIFTTDAACCPGVPAHVMVFLGWKDRERRIAWVVDNQGARHDRDLDGSAEHGVSAAVFGLRDAGK
jgi:hypothetical protein